MAPAVQRHLVTALRHLADELRVRFGHVAHHEERAPRVSCVEEVEDLVGEGGVTLLLCVGCPVILEVEGEGDEVGSCRHPGHQYASMSRNSKVSSSSAAWSTAGENERRIRWSGDGWSRRGGRKPRTLT